MPKKFSYPTRNNSPDSKAIRGTRGHSLPVSGRTIGFLREALREDIGLKDVTSNLLIPAQARGTARVIAKEKGVFCGQWLVMKLFRIADPGVKLEFRVRDGHQFRRGQTVFLMHGNIRSILKVERTMVNFIGHLSGVATKTRLFVNKVKKYPVLILDTRKTTPIWRELEKVAVQVGGARNHRQGLDEFIFVKENHRIHGTLKKLRRHPGNFEIEVRSLGELWEAIQLRPKVILLDNFTPNDAKRAVAIVRKEAPGVILEASGGITIGNVRKFAAAGVDTISVGSLTHSVKAVDFSLLVD
ncbi:MAG TPA: carboxylating nicotinate-nucleotide diphosphorylase [Candidatus Omnitrophota bacterium]|jgi:nicotinate-nucleotide pyrophosphorylase (carboxylating)|nr:MAG: Nicotinate-nucleotide pyrophosphorylase (carboxylating) [Candidatus Omnitrophica bacterium ADurb.Bin314]HQB93578.1 carboxylating nicotinate-nucleotide diphosphorylase [Candidatus Omnitrophota bacterium]